MRFFLFRAELPESFKRRVIHEKSSDRHDRRHSLPCFPSGKLPGLFLLEEPPKGPSKCDGCPYKRVKPCVSVPCYLRLGKNLNQRDTIVVRKIVGGYVKLLYPDEAYTKSQIEEILVFALEMRRVKKQLKKLGGMEGFEPLTSRMRKMTFAFSFGCDILGSPGWNVCP